MAKHIDAAIKQAVLADIKNGVSVVEASNKHGVTDNTIYTWLKKRADNTGTSNLGLPNFDEKIRNLSRPSSFFIHHNKRK